MSSKSHLDKLKALRKVDVQAGLVRSAAKIEDTAKRSIVSGGGIPSAPGQPPHNQTGALLAGITSGPLGENAAHVTSADPASASLEFGRSDARERPFLRPAVQQNLKTVSREVADQVRIKLKRV
jgi:hypothetical protein